jgi:hypothetical protein
MPRGDYVPRPDALFDPFFKNIVDYVVERTAKDIAPWMHIVWEDRVALEESYERWRAAYAVTLDPCTPVQRKEKTRVRKAEERVLREFVNMYLRHRPVTDADRDAMGIPNHDATRTDHIEVPETVDFVLHLRDIREIIIEFWIKGAAHKAKPDGYDGAVIIWAVGDAPFAHIDDIKGDHEMASRTPHALRFTDDQRGKTVSIALCWQNGRGLRGAWSEIKSAVIP